MYNLVNSGMLACNEGLNSSVLVSTHR